MQKDSTTAIDGVDAILNARLLAATGAMEKLSWDLKVAVKRRWERFPTNAAVEADAVELLASLTGRLDVQALVGGVDD
jgi:hypothetical protein